LVYLQLNKFFLPRLREPN